MKAIVLLSGGLDSTVLAADLLADGHEVKALSVDYGQRHRRELDHARAIAARLGIEHRIADLSTLTPFLAGSSQTSDDVAVPEGHYAEESMKLTVVSNRNMLLLSVATAWAVSSKADVIAYAAHNGDHAIYPDCRKEFIDKLAEAIAIADWHQVKLFAPFAEMSKADIARRGHEIGAPIELTWSCYKGGLTHCGKCGTCVERREAFELAGVPDLTVYE
jgi:7-cyano-7-deazaguanine synthase